MTNRSFALLALNFLAFVSLGLPDGLLGVAWPSMRATFRLPLGSLGPLLGAFTVGYVVSSFSAGAVLRRWNVGMLLAASCAATGVSLVGYATAPAWATVVFAAGLGGIGAGAIDTGVNAYVATHHGPRTLNWMHAAYGVGATSGPMIMTSILGGGRPWQSGYAIVAAGQLALAATFTASRSMWPAALPTVRGELAAQGRPLLQTFRLARTWLGAAAFFSYTGLEAVAGVWAYSVLTSVRGLSISHAGMGVSVYWAALTAGRVLFGLLVDRSSLTGSLRGALSLVVCGAVVVGWAGSQYSAVLGFGLLGLGAGPVFPSFMSKTPRRVGREHATNAIGLQVAAAALGQSFLPAFVGVLARAHGLEIVAPSLLVLALIVAAFHEMMAVSERGEARTLTPRGAPPRARRAKLDARDAGAPSRR